MYLLLVAGMACCFLKPDSAFYDAGSVLSPGPSHLGQATKLGLAECKVNTRGIFLRCWEAGVTTLTSISSSTQAGRGHSMNNHRFNASTREAGADRALWVWGQPDTDSGFQGSSETLFLTAILTLHQGASLCNTWRTLQNTTSHRNPELESPTQLTLLQ